MAIIYSLTVICDLLSVILQVEVDGMDGISRMSDTSCWVLTLPSAAARFDLEIVMMFARVHTGLFNPQHIKY